MSNSAKWQQNFNGRHKFLRVAADSDSLFKIFDSKQINHPKNYYIHSLKLLRKGKTKVYSLLMKITLH